ncbi:hypothetical protein WJX82_005451 [Trebouxia sp. C0006]
MCGIYCCRYEIRDDTEVSHFNTQGPGKRCAPVLTDGLCTADGRRSTCAAGFESSRRCGTRGGKQIFCQPSHSLTQGS